MIRTIRRRRPPCARAHVPAILRNPPARGLFMVTVLITVAISAVLFATALFATAVVAAGPDIGQKLGELLRDIPPANVPTGILYDRVLPLSQIDRHDGTAGSEPATTGEWRQMYSEMYRASLDGPIGPAPEEIAARARADARPEVIPVAVLDFRYDRIRPDALTTHALVARDGRLEMGRGDPFVERRVFAAAALRERSYRGGELTFRFERGNWFGNGALPARMQADFDDGRGPVPVPLGSDQLVHYGTTGAKTVRLTATFPDGSERHGSFAFQVESLRTPPPTYTLPITATIPYLGAYGTGDAYVYLAPNHTVITEPVVVLEGFDLDNSMYWDELYALLNRENLLENLRAQGFDPIVFNFTDATTYIQRNAMAAIELVQQVRDAVGAGHNMVLAGASMGGLVGRYALAYMETHAIPHAVRTFISFDAPQEGADIPLGIQYWVWFFAGESSDAAAWLAALDSPAARQLLVYHHTDPPGSSAQPDPLRAQLQLDLASVGGYPSSPRLVSIINGSGSRLNQGFNPGAQIIRWEYGSFLVDITGNVWAVANNASQIIFHGLIDFILYPADEVYVTVANTAPYDGAPGGWRDTMAQMDAVSAPYGDIVALYPNHCFIPSVSSLDINTTDLFYDIAGDPNLLAHVPFDAVYFPTGNQEHVEINAQNAPWITAEITSGATGFAEPPLAAAVARIEPPAPNPAAGPARVRFSVPRPGPARLAVYDAAGRQVAILSERTFEPGEWEASWNAAGTGTGPGVYFVRLTGPGFAAARKIVIR